MTLASLTPRIKGNFLTFDCPCGNCTGRIRIPLRPAVDSHGQSWSHTGDLEHGNLTLSPSVNAGCWHGFIREGMVTNA